MIWTDGHSHGSWAAGLGRGLGGLTDTTEAGGPDLATTRVRAIRLYGCNAGDDSALTTAMAGAAGPEDRLDRLVSIQGLY